MSDAPQAQVRSLRALLWLNFFVADVQTGLGPFLAAYLASSGWNPGRVGYALTFGGLVTVAMQTAAGAMIDAVHRKRVLLGLNLVVMVAGAVLLMGRISPVKVYSAQFLIGLAGAFLAPTIAAITLGIVGALAFDKQLERIKRSIPQEMYSPRCWLLMPATSSATTPYLWSPRCWSFRRRCVFGP